MKIAINTTLLPYPPSTRLRIRLAEDGMQRKISSIVLAAGHANCAIDWGDGTVETVTRLPPHTYAKAGEYIVRLSDDVSALTVSNRNDTDPTLLAFASNATLLGKIQQFCFDGCTYLQRIDVRESGLTSLDRMAFRYCTSLSSELYFPKVNQLSGTATSEVFAGCTGGITKIHFAKVNEAAIKASAPYQGDPTLGTGTAVCVFDL